MINPTLILYLYDAMCLYNKLFLVKRITTAGRPIHVISTCILWNLQYSYVCIISKEKSYAEIKKINEMNFLSGLYSGYEVHS